MQELGGHDQEFFKSLIPKARPSIRNINFHSLNHSVGLLQKNKMYKSKQHNSNFSDSSDDEIECTDDEDDDYEQIDNSSRYSNKTLNNSSQNPLLESFSSAHNYSYSTRVQEQSFRSRNTSQSANLTTSSPNPKRRSQSHVKSETQYFSIFLYSIIALIVVISIICLIVPTKNINQETVKSTEVKTRKVHLFEIDQMLDKSMQIIKAQFNNQKSSIWNDISAAIYDAVLYPKKPSIIVLFGKEANTLNCLAQLLGQLGGVVLGNKDYLTLTPNDFPNAVGQVVYDLKVQILQKPSVIIQDLLNINTEAIKAFHNFCDRETPLVENAIYIITMLVDDYTLSQKELEFVEKRLVKKLSGKIEKDILDPLITRLTDGIIVPILPELNTSFNRLRCSFPQAQVNKLGAVIS